MVKSINHCKTKVRTSGNKQVVKTTGNRKLFWGWGDHLSICRYEMPPNKGWLCFICYNKLLISHRWWSPPHTSCLRELVVRMRESSSRNLFVGWWWWSSRSLPAVGWGSNADRVQLRLAPGTETWTTEPLAAEGCPLAVTPPTAGTKRDGTDWYQRCFKWHKRSLQKTNKLLRVIICSKASV